MSRLYLVSNQETFCKGYGNQTIAQSCKTGPCSVVRWMCFSLNSGLCMKHMTREYRGLHAPLPIGAWNFYRHITEKSFVSSFFWYNNGNVLINIFFSFSSGVGRGEEGLMLLVSRTKHLKHNFISDPLTAEVTSQCFFFLPIDFIDISEVIITILYLRPLPLESSSI